MTDIRRHRRGFSLIELLISISIMLIIMMIAVPVYQQAMMHTRETAALGAIKTIHSAQVQYQCKRLMNRLPPMSTSGAY